MGAARFVGRVGGLAAALGLGSAVLFVVPAVASAQPDESSATESISQSSRSPDRPDQDRLSPTDDSDLTHGAGGAEEDTGAGGAEEDTGAGGAEEDTGAGGADRAEDPLTSTALAAQSAGESVQFDSQPLPSPEPGDVGSGDAPAPAPAADGAPATTVDGAPATTVDGAPAPATPSPAAAAASPPLGPTRPDTGPARTDITDSVTVTDGVITGSLAQDPWPNSPLPLSYRVIGKPSGGGKITLDRDAGTFSYLPYSPGQNPDSSPAFLPSENFKVLVAQVTPLLAALEKVPVLGGVVTRVVVCVQQVPIVRGLLAPLIGHSQILRLSIDDATVAAGAGAPIAFTTTVVNPGDGTRISVNWFPKVGLGPGDDAPTILNGPSLATAGYIDPTQENTVFGLVPGLKLLRTDYNVVTWDPRGEFASTGVLQLDSWRHEARDVQAIISFVGGLPGTRFDQGSVVDPLIGMVGGSYGGGIQLTSAGIDDRIDVIAPGIAWNNLYTTLYPNHGFKTSFASLLLLSLVVSGSRIDPTIYSGIFTGAAFGFLTPRQREFLLDASPFNVTPDIDIPVLYLQGTVDVLFPLQQALDNAAQIPGGPEKMIWYCGGHGQCLDPVDTTKQTDFLTRQTLAWMDTYLLGAANDIPTFQWVDQRGDLWRSDLLPIDPGFSTGQISTGLLEPQRRLLPVVPVLGGSGPQPSAGFPVSLATASVARNAATVAIPNPVPAASAEKVNIVGAPTVTVEYTGFGTGRNVYAQIVDTTTQRVVGNILTPVPVILDGRTRQVSIPMENIAYTLDSDSRLALQIVTTATPFENATSYGWIDIHRVGVDLPVTTTGTYSESFSGLPASPPPGSLLGV
ncbi:CocE/NonD family hydrolase [Mycobacterium sp. smrl_JER01]|uniref:CocE/NonD family hydrolase n=1 Tax=Mycobacterium sp. smrl_JER01 TaxID=3402633 RepID=UPI003AD10602